jgi:hypothetical protein
LISSLQISWYATEPQYRVPRLSTPISYAGAL